MSSGVDSRTGRKGPALCVPGPFGKKIEPIYYSFDVTNGGFVTGTSNDYPTMTLLGGVGVQSGKWYYEHEMVNNSDHQIGLLIESKYSIPLNNSKGVGNDEASWGTLGNDCIFANKSSRTGAKGFSKGDIVGVAIDLDCPEKTITWFRNGESLISVAIAGGEFAGKYEAGDYLTPAWNGSRPSSVAWRFTSDRWKHAPPTPDYQPLQAGSMPEYLTVDIKNVDTPDALSDCFSLLPELLRTAAQGSNPDLPGDLIKPLAEARSSGVGLDYGFAYTARQFEGHAKTCAKGFKGDGLELQTDGFRDADDARTRVAAMIVGLRALTQRLLVLAAVFPASEGTAKYVEPYVQQIDNAMPAIEQAWGYASALVAMNDRRAHKFTDYGLKYYLEKKVQPDVDKDNAEGKKTHGENLRVWRRWFIDSYTGPEAIKEVVLAPVAGLIIDCLGSDPDEAALAAEAAAKRGGGNPEDGGARNSALLSVPAATEDPAVLLKLFAIEQGKLETLSKTVLSELDNGDKQRDRFPERCEESYRKAETMVAAVEKKAAAFSAARAKNLGRVLKSMVGSAGIGALIGSDEYNAFMAAYKPRYHAWAAWHTQFLLDRTVERGMDAILREVGEGKNRVNHYDPANALRILSETNRKLAALRDEPGFWSAASAATQMAKYDEIRVFIETQSRVVLANQSASRMKPALSMAVSAMNKCISVNDFDGALKAHREAVKVIDEIKSTPEWADVESIQDAVREHSGAVDGFMEVYKQTYGVKRAQEYKHTTEGHMTQVRSQIDHHDLDRASETLQTAAKSLAVFKGDDIVATTQVALAYFSDFDERFYALKKEIDVVMIAKEASAAAHDIRMIITAVKHAFDHYQFDNCLTELAKLKTQAAALEESDRLKGAAAVEDVLAEVDRVVPEYEERYKTTMTTRLFDNAKHEAGMALTAANHSLAQSDYERSLEAMRNYKRQIAEMADSEQFRSQADTAASVEAYVKEAREVKIVAWQDEYEAKYIGLVASKLAREISDAHTNAQQHFDHSRFDDMLRAKSDLKRRVTALAALPAEDMSDEALASRTKTVQTAINATYGAMAELDKAYTAAAEERLVADAARECKGALEQARDRLGRSDFDAALEFHNTARTLASRFSLRPEGASDKAAAVLDEVEKQSAAFREAYSTAASARQQSDAARVIDDSVAMAAQCMSHYRGDDALIELNKARSLIAAFRASFPAAVTANSGSWDSSLAQVEADYAARVLGKQADELVGKASAQVASASNFIAHSNPDAALTALHAARQAAAEVAMETRIASLPKVVEFNATFPGALKAATDAYTAFAVNREGSERARELSSAMATMESHLFHSRYDDSLIAVQAAVKLRDALDIAADDYATVPAVAAALADAKERIPKFTADYSAKVGAKRLSAGLREIRDCLGSVRDHIFHTRFDMALTAMAQSRDLVGALSAEPVFAESADLDAFLKEYQQQTKEFAATIESKRAEAVKAANERDITDALNAARNDLEHSRNDRALEQLAVTRRLVAALESDLGHEDPFVAAKKAAMVAFEADFTERAFKTEVSRKIERADALLRRAENALDKHCVDESLTLLREATDASSLLGGDDRFLNTPSVTEFMTRFITGVKALRAKVVAYQAARAADDLRRRAESLLNEMASLYAHHRTDEALVSLRAVERLLDDELSADVAQATPALAPVRTDAVARTQEFRTRYQDEHLRKQAAAVVRGINALLDTAKFHLEHNRQTDALSTLNEAQQAAAGLNGSEYAGLDLVEAFFRDWAVRVSGLKSAINDVIVSQSVRDATGKADSALAAAKQCFEHHNYDHALTQLSAARNALAEIADDARIAKLPSVVSYLAGAEKRRAELATTISNSVFAKEVQVVVRSVSAHFARAKQMFERFAYDESLSALSTAKTELAAAADTDGVAAADAFKAFSASFAADARAFASQFAATVLTEQARSTAREVTAALAQARLFTERLIEDKAADALREARNKAVPFFNDEEPVSLTDAAAQSRADVAVVQTVFSEAFLAAPAAELATRVRRELAAAKQAEQRALPADELYATAFATAAPLIGASAKTPVAPAYAVLPALRALVTDEILPVAAARGTDLFAAAAAPTGLSGGSGKGGKVTIDSMLGERWPSKDTFKKGMVRLQKGPDLDPDFFRYADMSTNAYKNSQTGWREIEEGIQKNDMRLEAEGMYRCTLAIKQYDDMFKSMRNDSKVNDSEHHKNMAASHEAYCAAWKAMETQFDRREALIKLIEQIDRKVKAIQTLASDKMDTLNPYFRIDKNQVYLKGARDAVALTRDIERYSTELYNGFINENAYKKKLHEAKVVLCERHTKHMLIVISVAVADNKANERRSNLARLVAFPLARQAAWDRVERLTKVKIMPFHPKEGLAVIKDDFKLDGSTSAEGADLVEDAKWYVEDDRHAVRAGTHPSDAGAAARGLGDITHTVTSDKGAVTEGAASELAKPRTFKASDLLKPNSVELRASFGIHRGFNKWCYATEPNGNPIVSDKGDVRYYAAMYVRVNGENVVGAHHIARRYGCFDVAYVSNISGGPMPTRFEFPIVRYTNADIHRNTFTYFDRAFTWLTSRLPVGGKYDIDLDLAVIRHVTTDGCASASAYPIWPAEETSAPLSRGKFTLDLDVALPQRGVFPSPAVHSFSWDASLLPGVIDIARKSRCFQLPHPVRIVAAQFSSDYYVFDWTYWDELVRLARFPWEAIVTHSKPFAYARDVLVMIERRAEDGWVFDHDDASEFVEYSLVIHGENVKTAKNHKFQLTEELVRLGAVERIEVLPAPYASEAELATVEAVSKR